jgi:hypothetical protein
MGYFAIDKLRLSTALAVCTLAGSMVACGSNSTTTPTLTTDTVTGRVLAGSFDGRQFAVTAQGTVTLTLVSLAPQSTITMGVGIGQQDPTTGQCVLFGQNESFKVGGAPLTGSLGPGVYCFVIYDIGNVVGSVDYTLTLQHP